MSSKDRFKIVVAVHLFLIDREKILLARRFNTGYQDGNYSVPAGHVDGGEKATKAMIREAKEEVGIKIKEKDLEFVHVMHRLSDEERVDFFFVCKKWQGEPRIMEREKCDELKWEETDDLPVNTIPYVRAAIKSFQQKQFFSEFEWK